MQSRSVIGGGAIVLALNLAVSRGAQEVAPEKRPDPSLFDGLIQKTNDLEAFVAIYRIRIQGAEREKRMQIAYRAPGELRLEMGDIGTFQIRNGIMEVRSFPPGGSETFARSPVNALMSERRDRLIEALRTELPISKQDWPNVPDCGVSLSLEITPGESEDREDFHFQGMYTCPRRALLGWLGAWRTRTDLRFESDDHFVLRTAAGATLRVSTTTGFIDTVERVRDGETFGFKLESFDRHPRFSAESFEPLTAAEGAKDVSDALSAQMQTWATQSMRSELLVWLSRHIADKSIAWEVDERLRVRRVLECLYQGALAAEHGTVVTPLKKQMESLATYLRERYTRLADTDSEERDRLDALIDERREQLFNAIRSLFDNLDAKLSIDERIVPDAEVRNALSEVEHEALAVAFERAEQNPLMDWFDEQVKRARSGD